MRSFFSKKKIRLPQMRRVFLSSANAEDKKQPKNFFGSTAARTRDLTFAIQCSNHYSIPPSLESRLKIAYIKKSSKYFFRVRKKIIK